MFGIVKQLTRIADALEVQVKQQKQIYALYLDTQSISIEHLKIAKQQNEMYCRDMACRWSIGQKNLESKKGNSKKKAGGEEK
jgi:hypothetical protein